MILDSFVKIHIFKNSKNKNLFREKGYDIVDDTDIMIKVDDLPESSTFRVRVLCDICRKEHYIEYRHYLRNIKQYGYYSCQGKCSRKKFKQTNIDRYGVDNPAILLEIQEKIKTTNIERYGCENTFQSTKIKEKIKNTNLKKYGCENPNQNKDIKEKKKKTSYLKYGTEHPMHNEKIFSKNQKNCFLIKLHENTGLYYRSSYEKHFLDFCFNRNIIVTKGKRIEYFIENVKHYYFSDFFIKDKNLIVEIKSEWTYQNDIAKNKLKEEFTQKSGYDFLFVINKDYTNLLKKL